MSSMVGFVFFVFLSSTYRDMFYCRFVAASSCVIDKIGFFFFFFFCYSWPEISHSIFFSPDLVFFSKKVIYFTSISVCLYFSFFFSCFFRQPIVKCFVADLLRQVVVSSIVGFFVVFRVGSSDDKVLFDKVIVSNYDHHCAVRILGILSIFRLSNV